MGRKNRRKWEFPHKCRCGAWLFNTQIKKGHCTRCGPEGGDVDDPDVHMRDRAVVRSARRRLDVAEN